MLSYKCFLANAHLEPWRIRIFVFLFPCMVWTPWGAAKKDKCGEMPPMFNVHGCMYGCARAWSPCDIMSCVCCVCLCVHICCNLKSYVSNLCGIALLLRCGLQFIIMYGILGTLEAKGLVVCALHISSPPLMHVFICLRFLRSALSTCLVISSKQNRDEYVHVHESDNGARVWCITAIIGLPCSCPRVTPCLFLRAQTLHPSSSGGFYFLLQSLKECTHICWYIWRMQVQMVWHTCKGIKEYDESPVAASAEPTQSQHAFAARTSCMLTCPVFSMRYSIVLTKY